MNKITLRENHFANDDTFISYRRTVSDWDNQQPGLSNPGSLKSPGLRLLKNTLNAPSSAMSPRESLPFSKRRETKALRNHEEERASIVQQQRNTSVGDTAPLRRNSVEK